MEALTSSNFFTNSNKLTCTENNKELVTYNANGNIRTYTLAKDTLTKRLKEAKDFCGCTVALSFSDLNALTKNNIRRINADYFMEVRSIKTNIETLVKLPQYAVDIIKRYKTRKKKLLPQFNISNINKYIKKLTEKAGFTQTVLLTRHRRGKPVVQQGKKMKRTSFL